MLFCHSIGNSIFLLIFKIFGIKTISIADGADWEEINRKICQNFFKVSDSLLMNLSHYYVVDNEILMSSYNEIFRKKLIYIPYRTLNQVIQRNIKQV